jgi:N-carbamoyl-L-amino-acid hydrolase
VSGNRLVVDRAIALAFLDGLAADGADPPGITRDAYGPGEQRAHDRAAALARDIGLEVAVDPAGTLLMTLPGRDPEAAPFVVGSHLDSVPHGGNVDGAAGVAAGLAAVAALRSAGLVPPRPIVVAAFRAEESTWFPVSYPGSRAALGLLPSEVLDLKRADSGLTMSDHMARLGLDPAGVAAGRSILRPDRIHGFLEVHIEQGPVLEGAGIPVGLVTAISGSFRYRSAAVTGDWAHSGAVPRPFRRDAVVALARLVCAMDDAFAAWSAAGDPTTVTFGQVATDPDQHAFSKVAGRASFCIDVRSPSAERLEVAHARLVEAVAAAEDATGARFDLGPRSASAPAVLDAGLRSRLGAVARDLAIPAIEMPSGAGHDTAVFANAGIPSALVFVRNQNGSHNPDEAMRMEDFDAAVDLVAAFLAGLDRP